MEAEIREVFETIRRAYRDRDASALAPLYAPGAVIYDLAPPLGHRGLDVAGLERWFAGWRGPVEQELRDVEITVRGDLAFAHGMVQVKATTVDGEEARWWMRSTACLVREGGKWRIAHEHTSVPFHMDGSFRAATDLEP